VDCMAERGRASCVDDDAPASLAVLIGAARLSLLSYSSFSFLTKITKGDTLG
jgi:hypothetical protein